MTPAGYLILQWTFTPPGYFEEALRLDTPVGRFEVDTGSVRIEFPPDGLRSFSLTPS